MSDLALFCQGLVHVYREAGTDVAALRGVDLVVPAAQRVAVLGPSGSGKSTLLSIVAGVTRPSAGRAEVFGTDLATARPADVRRLRRGTLGLMMQGAPANLLAHEDAAGNLDRAVGGSREAVRVGRRVLRAGGVLGDRRPVGRLTPTEQQVVALAVALAPRPRLLLADEPTSRLGETARDALLDLLVDTADAAGTAVLVVTHDDAVAARMQRMVHLRDGRVGEEATAEGRWSVLGTDGSLQLPQGLRTDWPDGALVSVDEVAPGELRVRRVTDDEGGVRG
ncbi:putative ABC transport system ATP-binding protein [Frigoribacterium sp. PvP054]|uniref:ABC transporter ATP-binding protein n=1 Tax=Frigoribacterium sp. PvP054 TaxID=3156438 RepID=UPI003399DB3B